MGLATGIALAGLGLQAKGQRDSSKAASQAAQAAQGAKIDIPAIAKMAEEQALRNIQLSRETEQKYNPENAEFRSASLKNLLENLQSGSNADIEALLKGINTATGVGPVQAEGIAARSADSDLLRSAIARAQSDLDLGGALPLDVRNLVARNAASRAGAVGDIRLGRDLTTRDLGLTSLDLAERRLARAQALGQAELGANQFNASAAMDADRFGAGARNTAALQSAQMQQQANQFGVGTGLNIAQLLASMRSGDYGRALSAAQFGQGFEPPMVGLDPSSIANLAVGNSNIQAQGAQNAANIRAAQGQGWGQLGGQLFGLGSAMYRQPTTPPPITVLPATTVPGNAQPAPQSTIPGWFPSTR